MPVLLSVLVLALIACIVRPDLLAVPMLLVFVPVAFVAGAIRVMVVTEAVRLIVFPLTLVNITILVK